MSVILRRKVDKIDEGNILLENQSGKEKQIITYLQNAFANVKSDFNINITDNREDIKLDNGLKNSRSDIVCIITNTKTNDKIQIYIEEISKYHFDFLSYNHRAQKTLNANGIIKTAIFTPSQLSKIFVRQVINLDYEKYKYYIDKCKNNENIYVFYILPDYINDKLLDDCFENEDVIKEAYEKIKIMYSTSLNRPKNFIVTHDVNLIANKISDICKINKVKTTFNYNKPTTNNKNKENANNDKQ